MNPDALSSISDIPRYHKCMNTELTFGEWLEDQILGRGMTQVEFSEAIDVGQTTVSAWVNNVSPPSRRNAYRVARFLGIPALDVLERAGIKPTSRDLRKEPPADSTDPDQEFWAAYGDKLTAEEWEILERIAESFAKDKEPQP